MLWTLMKKELREASPAGVLGLVASCLLLLVFMQPIDHDRFEFVPVATDDYIGWQTKICCGLGLLLGFLMSWKEALNKTWHFLIHRPVSKSRILTAKLLSGAILYFCAVGLPFLFFAVQNSIPGMYPGPWTIEYAYPGLEALARGLLLFLAAFLCGIREAQWYGTRFMPLAGTIILILLAATAQSWLFISAIYFVNFVLLLGAIWAAFVPAKHLRPALALLLCAGITAPVLVIVSFALNLVVFRPLPRDEDSEHVHPCFSLAGEPRLWVQKSSGGSTSYSLKTVDGELIGDSAAVHEKLLPMAFGTGAMDRGDWRWEPGCRRYPVSNRRFWDYSRGDDWRRTWYFLSKERLLVCYDWYTRKPIVYGGRNGFTEDRRAVQPFSDRGPAYIGSKRDDKGSHLFVRAADGIFVVDIEKQSVTKIFDQDVLTMWYDNYYLELSEGKQYQEQDRRRHLFLNGHDFIAVCDPQGENVKRFMLPKDVRLPKDTPLPVGAATGRFVFESAWINENTLGLVTREIRPFADTFPDMDMYKIDTGGNILWSKHVPISTKMNVYARPEWDAWISSFILPAWAWERYAETSYLSFVWRLGFGGIKALIAKLLCAALAFFLLRKRGHSWLALAGWSLFAYLGGVPALLTVWALLLNEKRLRCPACGGKRPPSLPACPRCAAPWPAPERRETDIFATERLVGGHP